MSDAEAVRYDRQIRLWGKSTQQQLTQTNVIFHGIAGAAAETAKNLVLAGVRGVAVLDEAAVSTADARANYLMQGEAGHTRADRAIHALRRLNPYVDVRGSVADLEPAQATVCVMGITSIQAGSALVSLQASSAPQPDVVVLHTTLGHVVVAFVLYRRLAVPLAEQWERLVASPASLQEKPRRFQQAILALHLRSHDGSAPPRSFAEMAAMAYEVISALHLQLLTALDVEEAVVRALSPSADAADCVGATTAGASIAQHVIRQIGGLQAAPDTHAHRWLLCDTGDEVECIVGL